MYYIYIYICIYVYMFIYVPKFLRISGERSSAWWRLTWQTTVMTKATELIMRNNCARYFWQQDYEHVGV